MIILLVFDLKDLLSFSLKTLKKSNINLQKRKKMLKERYYITLIFYDYFIICYYFIESNNFSS